MFIFSSCELLPSHKLVIRDLLNIKKKKRRVSETGAAH